MHISKKISVFICLHLWLIFFCFSAQAQTLAPGAPGKDAQWASAGKQGVGTSAGAASKVWFTLEGGAMTEVYYPNVTTANVHKLEFVVVNPKTKKVETETDDAIHEVKVTRPDSLTFQQINTAKSKEWQIVKTYVTDVENNSVLINVQIDSNNEDLKFYLYYDPSLANSGMNDTAWDDKNVLFSKDNDKVSALLIGQISDGKEGVIKPMEKPLPISNGYYKVSDGLEQLKKSAKLIPYPRAENGNVVQTAEVFDHLWARRPSGEILPKGNSNTLWSNYMTVVLAFGKDSDEALKSANASAQKGFYRIQADYEKGWSDYVKTLPKVDEKYQAQLNMAAMELKAHEDKTHPGANIASLTVPWGGGANANENNVGGYHLVWSRDLYQVATAYMALGDTAAANRALDFVFNVQQKPDGSFPQNSFLDGKPFWGSLQLDEVAFPLILAYQLKRFDKPTYENHVKRAADFIVKTGPKTPQERWEEKSGYSPSTIAAEIAGLVCAADIAQKNGDTESANLYLKTADDWQANVEKWTATTNGKYGDGNYYVRLTENGTPDAKEKTVLNNGAGTFIENEIVDAGFLELVRLGIKSPDDPLIVKSLKVIDSQIKVSTPNGEAFYRYNHDGYGEMNDGRRWNWDGKYTGQGRLWVLLSGERGQYELARYNSAKYDNSPKLTERQRNSNYKNYMFAKQRWQTQTISRLDAMLAFANDGLMIPEQIWDSPNVPQNIDKQFIPELKFGEGTGSATPLAWSMAQFIRLAVNLQAGRNLDTPDVVYNRYVLKKKSEAGNHKAGVKFLSNESEDVDITEVPVSFASGVDTHCFSDKPLYKKDCSYASILAKEDSQNPQLVDCGISGFYVKCKDYANEMHACFNYKGEFKTLEIAGDFTDWKPVILKVKKTKEGYSAPCFNFVKNARVEYKLIVDGKWITDPLNPNKVDNGVGGENSFFTMPDYKATIWDTDAKMTGKLETIEIQSKVWNETRKIQVYTPQIEGKVQLSLRKSNPLYPVMYLQDGADYINRAKAIQIQENLVKAGKLKPFMMVFVDYKDRMKEYWASDDYAKYLAEEVVPWIDKQYRTVQSADGRAILGASLGGVTSVHTALKYPQIFGRVGGQSSSFWIDNQRVIKELENLDTKQTKLKFYFDAGTIEGAGDDEKVVGILKQKGYAVTYEEAAAGHNWTSWRDRLADAFIALWN